MSLFFPSNLDGSKVGDAANASVTNNPAAITITAQDSADLAKYLNNEFIEQYKNGNHRNCTIRISLCTFFG